MTETAAPAAPPVVADYFTRYTEIADVVRPPYSVAALFVPGRGWLALPLAQQVPVTVDWARGAQAAGAMAARIGNSGIYADFQLTELV